MAETPKQRKIGPHTPGPWHVGYRQAGDEDGWADYQEYDRQCGVWAEPAPTDSEYEPYVVCQPDTEADAELIAAAPDLLAACRLALQWIPDYPQVKADVKAEIRAAISKAIGSTKS